jgi:protein-disulfide isomerase
MNRNIVVPAVVVAVVLALVAAVALGGSSSTEPKPSASTATAPAPTATEEAAAPRVAADDAHRLGRPGSSGVVFTEFLDFECESCRAAFPVVEELRRQYAGRVTFQLRYFPLPSHRNAENAALAVEAAAQQGKLEAMYKRMYETQLEWGEQSDSKAALFRQFAEDLGLDLQRYDAAVKDPATLERIRRDSQLGQSVGVQGTPTFFLGEEMIQPQSVEELKQLLDDAVAEA